MKSFVAIFGALFLFTWAHAAPQHRADLAGRLLGRFVAMEAWQKAQGYFDGTTVPQISLALSTTEPVR